MAKSPLEIWQDGPSAQPYQPPKQDIRDWALWVEGLLDPDASGTGVDFATDLTALDNSLSGHLGNHNNPHQVTKAQIGLGNVDNTADIDKPASLAMGVEHDLLAGRPGDMPHHFVDRLDGGDPSILHKLALGQGFSSDAGFVRRIAGAGVIARRTLFAIEPGKVYAATFVVQRRTDTPDPSNDAVRCALAWYNQGASPAATAQTVVQDLLALTVGSGRTLVTATIARAAGDGISVIAPADARYVRPFVQLYGTTSVTDIELIDWEDVTHANGYSPNLDALTGRVGALESIDAGDRIAALEAEVSAPNTTRLATVADLTAATIPATVNVVELQGYHHIGDGGGLMLLRLSALEAAQPGELVSNGGTVRWGIASGQQINVRMFGAAGDGTADDTSSFTATFAYAQLTKADVFVPAGTYLIASTFVVPDGVHVRGDGGGYLYSHNTKILFNGAGTKSYSINGATSTSVANPSVGEAYLADSGTRGDTYKTNDFSVNFSAGIILGKNSGLHNLGIYPFLDGTDGYAGTDGRLSDEWDVGVWARSADWWQIDNCIVYGHWRKTALLVSSHDLGDGKTPSCEKGRAIGSHFQGFAGVSVRSPETIVGTNFGFAGTSFIDCDIRPLSHQSGHLATSSQLDLPFSSPSMCMEVSGGTMRGLKWYNCTFIGPDDICVFFGKASELFFTGAYAEAQMIKVSGSLLANSQGSRMIATSSATALMWAQHAKFAIDFTPYQARDIGLASGRYTAAGVFNPSQADDDDYSEQRFASWRGPRLRGSSQGWRITDESNNVPVQITHDGVMTFGSKGGLSIPSDTTANLSSLTSSINTTGKFLNKLVFNSTTGMLMRANGGATNATWKDMLAGNTITPV